MDAVVVVQEDRPHVQGLFEVAVALFDDPLVFVDVEHVERGQFPVGRVGQVGGDGVEPVESGRGGDGARVGVPGDGGWGVCGDAGGDGDEGGDGGGDGDGGGFCGGPDVGDAQPVGGAGVVVEDLSLAQHALPQGALLGGQPSFALGAVVECGQRVDAAVDVGGEPLGPAGVGAQRHHEPQPGGIE